MRIISGQLKGREFGAPKGHKTHPMSDKARGALFNVLGDVDGLTFLDAFAGSGALSFEAISRGAASAVAIDQDKHAYKVIEQNIAALDLSNVKAIQAGASGWSETNNNVQFDILLLDPPYDNLQQNLLEKLVDRHIKPGGLVVLSWPGKRESPTFKNCELVIAKNYSDSQLAFYRKIK